MIFEKPKPKDSTPPLTIEVASEIYEQIKLKGRNNTFLDPANNSAYELQHINIVYDEAKAIESLANQLMSGSYLELPEESHVDEETGEIVIDSEAVYYTPTTKTDLVNQIESDYLDVETVITDMQNGKTWTEFKASFN